MKDAYDSMRKLFIQTSGSEDNWEMFVKHTTIKYVHKGSQIIKAGDCVSHAYYCTEGLFRLYYILEDGREYNVSFSLEHEFVTAYAAMITGQPSTYSIEALEDSKVIEISHPLLEKLMNQSHAWERFVRKSVEKLYISKEQREQQLLYLSAKDRYAAFLQKYPGLEQRLAQYQIASYIGISPVSLSRLLRKT